jgi:predicted transcriptional regulator
MKVESINKQAIMKSITKMVIEKDMVRSFIKGKTSLETLTKKGIKFAEPL